MEKVYPEYFLDTNLPKCKVEGIDVSEYTYREDLENLGENTVININFDYLIYLLITLCMLSSKTVISF